MSSSSVSPDIHLGLMLWSTPPNLGTPHESIEPDSIPRAA